MNVLGHYAVAVETPLMVRIGQVLPDLLSIFQRRLKPKALMTQWTEEYEPVSEDIQALIEGMHIHISVDVDFHHSDCFLQCEKSLLTALRACGEAQGLKRFIVAHLLTELFFDHVLIGQTPTLGKDLQGDLKETQLLLHQLISAHPMVDSQAFSIFQNRLQEQVFFGQYTSVKGVIAVINRLLQRIGQRSLFPEEELAVIACWQQIAQDAVPLLNQFISHMQTKHACRS